MTFRLSMGMEFHERRGLSNFIKHLLSDFVFHRKTFLIQIVLDVIELLTQV
jgi:hypothetical protein